MRLQRHPKGLSTAILSILVSAVLWTACGGDPGTVPPDPPTPVNRAPTATPTAGSASLEVGQSTTLSLATQFSDPDNDVLTYSASSSDNAVATVSLSGSQATVTGVAPGTATVTFTATDPDGLSASFSVVFTVNAVNGPPAVVGTIIEQNLMPGESWTDDVADLFTDPDGDSLAYSAASSDDSVATASAEGSVVTVTAVAAGSATITVTATDPGGLSASLDFAVFVAAQNQAPQVTDSIPAQTLTVGDTARIDPSDYFTDPDGDDLSYEAVSSNTGLVTALIDGNGEVEIGAQAVGSAVVTVTASDPGGLSASQMVAVSVSAAPPIVADTIPTFDMIVDSAVPLDLTPYFADPAGDMLIYTAATEDAGVAVASARANVLTVTGAGAVMDSVSVTHLSVTAANGSGGSVVQDSIVVRVHQEEYDTLPGISVDENGTLLAEVVPGRPTPLTVCLQIRSFPVGGQNFTIFWSEWQLAVGGGWITVQDNNKAHVTAIPGNGGSICPIHAEEDRFPPGVYRLVGHVQIGDEASFSRTPTFEKRPPEG